MLQPRIPKTLSTPTSSPLNHLAAGLLDSLTICPRHTRSPIRIRTFTSTAPLPASHAAQGRANGPKDSAGRRLGSKRGASEYVVPGNIIFKQRGTKWFPGENVGMGKDHTIYATEYGWVQYYRNPELHPKRRYIGVALAKEGTGSKLPTPANAVRRRRVGMVAVPLKVEESEGERFLEAHLSANSVPKSGKGSGTGTGTGKVMSQLELGQWTPMRDLVREAEANQVDVRPFDRRDRWFAWRQRTKKFEAKKLLRAATGKGKKARKPAKVRK